MNSMTPTQTLQVRKSIIAVHILNGNLDELILLIDDLIINNDYNVLGEIISVISKPELLSLLIHLILNKQAFFDKTSIESYYHENGFHKIVLLSGSNFKLRLHHFGASAKVPMENIHDHRWPFVSSILHGQLNMDIFEVTEANSNAEELHHFVYNSNKETGFYSTELQGVTYLQRSESRSYCAGDQYLMLPNELHRIKNQSGAESITLILTGKPQSRLCNLYAKRNVLEKENATCAYSKAKLSRMLHNITEVFCSQKN